MIPLVLALAPHRARAAEDYWKNTSGGNFTNDANWVDGSAPGTGDNARFTSNATYQVDFTSSATNSQAFFTATNGVLTLNIGSGNLWRLSSIWTLDGNATGSSNVVILSSGTLSSASDNILGSSGSNNRLVIQPGGNLIYGSHIRMGDAAGSSGNSLLVTGSGAVVSNSSFDLVIGRLGYANNLTIANGGFVYSQRDGDIGVGSGASNNTVLVTDPGSVWRMTGPLMVGVGSRNNSVTISNTGLVINANGVVGGGSTSGWGSGSGNDNWVLVTTGGIWSNGNLTVGYNGNGNSLTVSNGGIVASSGQITVGNTGAGNQLSVGDGGLVTLGDKFWLGGLGASNSQVVVSGPTAQLKGVGTYSDMYVGYQGVSSSLIITNGGQTTFNRDAIVGAYASSSNNQVTVTGPGSVWQAGGYFTIAGNGNTLTISNTGKVVNANHGYVGGGANSGGLPQTGSGTNNTVLVTSGGIWSNNWLYIGYNGSGNSVTVSNGSVIALSGQLHVGESGANNRLEIGPEGTVYAPSHWYLGQNAGASNNTVLITGSGAVLSNTLWDSHIGVNGSGNSLILSNGGKMYVYRDIFIGESAGGSNTQMIVTGNGSDVRFDLSQADDVYVGYNAPNNSLLIADGALVTDKSGWVGFNSGANANQVTVDGGYWTNTSNLVIGNNGRGNSLVVSNGGVVFGPSVTIGNNGSLSSLTVGPGGEVSGNGHVFIGGGAGATNTTVLVTGSGAKLQALGFDLNLGQAAGFNSVTISNGGYAFASRSLMLGGSTYGSPTSSSNNQLVVTGPGSKLQINGIYGSGLFIGYKTEGNSMLLEDGALVLTADGYLGGSGGATYGAGSGTNNQLTVRTGGVWTNSNWLYLGYSGLSNRAVVETGGVIYSAGISLGSTANDNSLQIDNGTVTANGHFAVGNAGGSGNTILVTGSNALLRTVSYDFGVGTHGDALGSGGYNSSVTVSNGAQMNVGRFLYVGSAYATNNQVIVTGPGSTLRAAFTNPGGYVSVGGTNNSLRVQSGGMLEVNQMIVANAGANSISNTAGIFQFTTASPTITPGSFGRIVVDGGTISFRAINNADIRGNVIGTLANMAFAGDNAFMLNAASNTTASQTYTFDSFANTGQATNYQALVMVNGATAYRGGNVTIGSGGAMLASNTQATITGIFSNNAGQVVFVNSVGTFNSAVVNSGAWTLDPSTNVFLDDYTVAGNGSVQAGAGDRLVFGGDFINQSAQSNVFDTLSSGYLFNGGGPTQVFATAGKDYGPEAGYTPGNTNNPLPLLEALPHFTNNFAVGTLELSNFSTVRVADAFLGVNDDGLRAALYVNELLLGTSSWLIIDTNVTVYFVSSNNWAAVGAGYTLLGDAELHLLVPEPSVLLLALCGSVALALLRRRRPR